MASEEQAADEAARLEAALERIAAARRTGREPLLAAPPFASGQVTERLDALITGLRSALAEQAD